MAKRFQFSLRSVFLVTTAVAIVSFLAIRPHVFLAALSALPFAACGCTIGAIAGRVTGTDWFDAAIGGTLGAVAAFFVWLMWPVVY